MAFDLEAGPEFDAMPGSLAVIGRDAADPLAHPGFHRSATQHSTRDVRGRPMRGAVKAKGLWRAND